MYIRKRGQFFHYEFFVNGKRYAGSFNGKKGTQIANDKKEARELAYQERRKVLDGTYRDEMEREDHVRRDILGHSATSITGDDTHSSPEEMERAMELVASYKGQRGFRPGKNLGKISAKQETAANLQSAAGL